MPPAKPARPERTEPRDPEDREGWIRQVLERHERPLTLYAWRILGDIERARDVVQETFLRLCKQERAEVASYQAEWLFTVCRNLARDVQRKESRMSTLSDTQAEITPGASPSPAADMERSDTKQQVLASLSALPPKQAEVLRLKFQHGLSYKEIGRVMDEKIGTVGWLIHEGLKSLKERMERTEWKGAQA